jgi:hypothetical protein
VPYLLAVGTNDASNKGLLIGVIKGRLLCNVIANVNLARINFESWVGVVPAQNLLLRQRDQLVGLDC